jgi:hypothetical protein
VLIRIQCVHYDQLCLNLGDGNGDVAADESGRQHVDEHGAKQHHKYVERRACMVVNVTNVMRSVAMATQIIIHHPINIAYLTAALAPIRTHRHYKVKLVRGDLTYIMLIAHAIMQVAHHNATSFYIISPE